MHCAFYNINPVTFDNDILLNMRVHIISSMFGSDLYLPVPLILNPASPRQAIPMRLSTDVFPRRCLFVFEEGSSSFS